MESKRCGLLLTGGQGPCREVLEKCISSVDFIIAADSGFDLAIKLKIEPDMLVGDLDSLTQNKRFLSYPEEKIRKFPKNKDETDTEIGLRFFREMGYSRVILAGGGGGRLDHLLGIISFFERDYHPYMWYTADEHIQVIDNELKFGNWKGQTVSFFPLGDEVFGIQSAGLKWPLSGIHWKRGQAGISNLFNKDYGSVSVKKGKLLMIRILPGLPDA